MFQHQAVVMIPPLLIPVATVCAAIVLLLASFNDIAARTLPNWTSLALVVIGLALRGADATLLASLAIASVVFFLALQCWRRGWLGGGDVKLLAAATMLVPPGQVFHLVMATAMAGGVLAMVYLLLRQCACGQKAAATPLAAPRSLPARILRVECWRINRRGSLPYGCAIAAAALFMLIAPAGTPGT